MFRGPPSRWGPFGPLDFVLRTLRALRPVRRACLRSGLVKVGHFLKQLGLFSKMVLFFFSSRFEISGSMIPRLVTKISPCDGFCDGVAAAGAGVGHSSIVG